MELSPPQFSVGPVFGIGLSEVLVTLLALVAILVAGYTLTLLRGNQLKRGAGVESVPEDLLGLRQEVAALRAEVKGSFKHLAVVRYDAFADMGGHLSWSVALLDDGGNGVVLTSIHGRSDARSYAKTVTAWKSDAQLSPEEDEAISTARA